MSQRNRKSWFLSILLFWLFTALQITPKLSGLRQLSLSRFCRVRWSFLFAGFHMVSQVAALAEGLIGSESGGSSPEGLINLGAIGMHFSFLCMPITIYLFLWTLLTFCIIFIYFLVAHKRPEGRVCDYLHSTQSSLFGALNKHNTCQFIFAKLITTFPVYEWLWS